ncbi:hypothetical protein [Nocardia carnea]|uniref:hypothetical protein n=1 Tax=Nocardia carnea TaxID=37328 RepID=UPI0024585E2F|nr:hypothetical protein [Nocardia carnea]
MKYKKLAATAIMAAAATGIAAGTGYAAPAPAAPAVEQQANAVSEVTGHDRGVDYTLALAEAGKSLITTVSGGTFSMDAANNAVVLTNAAGERLTSIPLSQQTGDQVVAVAATIEEDSSRLTLTPQATPVAGAPAQAQFIGAQQWFMNELQDASLGAAVGAAIGAAVGFLFLGIGLLPGAIIGAGIGLAVAGGPPLLDSAIAYFSGQP